MILDHQLAQQIVDRTMSIIGNNINVMNQAGIIIASGDQERIGQLHDGALLALKRKDTVEVTLDSKSSLQGVKQGINLLLKHSDDIVGVVGITGEPNVIRNYAELVKMTAEMAIEQAILSEKLQWNKRHREELVQLWLTDQLTQPQLKKQAHHLNVDIQSARYVIIIKFNHSTAGQDTVRSVIELLENEDRDNLLAVTSLAEIVLLKKRPPSPFYTESDLVQRLGRLLSLSGFADCKLALGKTFTEVSNIHHSFASSEQVLQFGECHYPEKKYYLFDDFRMAMLLAPVKNHWQQDQLLLPYRQLEKHDRSGQLRATLLALFEHNGNLKSCADSLSIHRNTLRYRLDKIETLTGLSTQHFSGLVELYLAFHINKLN